MRPRVRHIGRMVVPVAVGALLAGVYLIGGSAATRDPPPEPAESRRQPGELHLASYCRFRFGPRAAAYRPSQLEDWRCSVWRNDVWGLEEVNLADACHWQAGPSARLVPAQSGSTSTETRLVCTL